MARERLLSRVTPSGVAYTIRNLIGADQGLLTDMKKSKDGISGFSRMMAGAIKQIGNQHKVDELFVDRMLTNDRKDILVQLRQHTLGFLPTFDFTFEWAIGKAGKDASLQKQLQEYSVDFNEEDFSRIPFKWMREAIAERKAQDPDYDETKWPVLYESYQEMLNAHLDQTFFAAQEGEDGLDVTYQLLTPQAEKKISAIAQNNLDSNTLLMRYQPKIRLVPKEEDAEPVVTSWEVKRADVLDLEAFRKKTRDIEGFIDTYLAIKNQKDATQQQRIDLVDTVDFFFPSRAI